MNVGFFGEQWEGGIVIYIVMMQESAMTMAGVFAEADVGEDDDVLAKLCLDGFYGTGDEGIIGIGSAASFILLLVRNHSEEEHLVDAEILDFFDVLQKGIDAEAIDAWHGGNLLLLVFSLYYEVRVDEVCGTQ